MSHHHHHLVPQHFCSLPSPLSQGGIFLPNTHLNLALLPSATLGFSQCPTRSSWPNSIFVWGFFFLPISKDLRYYKSWDVEHQNWGFNSLAGKNHESQSTGALRDIKLHKPCSNLRTQWGGRREIWRLILTLSRSLEQSIPRTTSTGICLPAMSQGASLEAGDKLGSQASEVSQIFVITSILPCCAKASASGSQILFQHDRITASGFCVPHCAPTCPLPAQGSCHLGSFHPFYRGNQCQDQRRLLGEERAGTGEVTARRRRGLSKVRGCSLCCSLRACNLSGSTDDAE